MNNAPQSLPSAPPLMARINPPQDVMANVAAVRAACGNWAPTVIDAEHPISFSSEAVLCDQLTGVTHPEVTSYNVGMVTGIAGTLLVVGVMIVVRDVYRGIRHFIRERFRFHADHLRQG